MRIKKLAAVLLAVVMVFTFAACSSPDVKWIADVDGENVPSGVYIALMFNAYSESIELVADPDTDPRKQDIEGKPGSQWIQERTEELFRQYLAIEQKAKEMNVALDPVTKAGLGQQIDGQWQFLGPVYEENGVSYESFVATTENSYKSTLIFHATYGKDGTNPIPEAEMLKAFQDGFHKVEYTTMSFMNDEGKELDEIGKKAVMDKANELLAKATAPGANFSNVILDYEIEQAILSGTEVSEEHKADANAHIAYINKTSTSNDPEFMDSVASIQQDEAKVFTIGTTVYIMKKLDSSKATVEEMEDYRTTVMDKLKGEEYKAARKGWADAVQFNYHAESKALYTPEKLKL